MKYPIKGSILILVLWVLLLLSIFTFSAGYAARQRLLLLDRLEARETLRAIAEAGVQAGIQTIQQKDPKSQKVDSLNEEWSRNDLGHKSAEVGNGYFLCEIVDEERKINLNETNSALILTRLFEVAAKLDEQSASDLAVALLDFRDEDDDPYESGAESRYYESLNPAYRSKNAAFDSLEELLFVRGMTPAILEKIRPFVTLVGSPRVNLNTASKEVLHALGFSESLVESITLFRNGRDQQPGTRDDRAFLDLGTAAETLESSGSGGVSEKNELQNLVESGKLDVHSENFLIESRARIAHSAQSLTVRCVTKRNAGITGWSEAYLILSAKGEIQK